MGRPLQSRQRRGVVTPRTILFPFTQNLVRDKQCLDKFRRNPSNFSKMKIYKDVFSGDELFSDTYPIKLVEDCIYEVTGKHVSRKAGADFVLEGSNASAEEADEGTEEATESGVDLVLNHRLVETGFGKKADYMNYLKDYMKRVVAYLESNDKKDQVEGFKKNINGVMKGLLGRFNDLQFYTGENMDPKGMIVLVDYKEVDGEERPIIMFFKHGLEEEKC